jgi:hypothetical protein
MPLLLRHLTTTAHLATLFLYQPHIAIMSEQQNGQRRPSLLEQQASKLKTFLVGDGGNMGLCSNLAMAIVTLIFLKDSHWTSVDPIIYGAAIFIIMISRITTDNSEIGERIFYVIFLITVCAVYYLINFFLDHDCTICMFDFPCKFYTFVVFCCTKLCT